MDYTSSLHIAIGTLVTFIGVLLTYIKQQKAAQQTREDNLHEQYRIERDGDKAELRKTREEFTQALFEIAGIGKTTDK